jgi:hypothetical protein
MSGSYKMQLSEADLNAAVVILARPGTGAHRAERADTGAGPAPARPV